MIHAKQCPVCLTKGKVMVENQEKICHGCGGRGWVEVGSDQLPYIPYIPSPYPNTTPWVPLYNWPIITC